MPGSGSELYRGLGSVVLGGLLVSTIFTILLTPLLLSLVLDFSEKLNGAPATGDETVDFESAQEPGRRPVTVGLR